MTNHATNLDIISISDLANNWFHNQAIPLWYDKGIDWKRGGVYELLNFNDLSCAVEYKRVRVLTRQIYVFCSAYRSGDHYVKPAISHSLDFLIGKFRLKTGGYASRVTNNGEIIEGPIDFYDLSFCLFALAHAYKISCDSFLKDEAFALTMFITEHLCCMSGGFAESIPKSFPRRQNPHMHLLEALLEWRLVCNDSLFREISDIIIELFFKNFFCPENGALIEYFDDNLKPVNGPMGGITEPGHHFEWVWLIHQYQMLSNNKVPEYSKLYDFAKHYGINHKNGFLWGNVNISDASKENIVRLWPHAEWIKAEIVYGNETDFIERLNTAWRGLYRFLRSPQPGLWYETFDHAKNHFIGSSSPASSFYHIALAIETLITFSENQK